MKNKHNWEWVEDRHVLRNLSKAGKIVWPVSTNNSKMIPFLYVDNVPTDSNDGYNFQHKDIEYTLKFHSGCFMPYLYKKVFEN